MQTSKKLDQEKKNYKENSDAAISNGNIVLNGRCHYMN